MKLDAIFSLRLLKKVLYNIQRYPRSTNTEMDEEKVLISTYYEEICLHLDENNSTKLAALMTSVTSIVLPINAEIEGNNVNVFKHKSFQFNMDKSYLTSSNFIAERVQSMHDIIVSGNNLLVYGGAGIGKTVCIDVLAQTMSQTEKVKVASQLIEGVRSTAIGVVEERTSVSSTKTPNDTGKMVIFSDSESDEDSDSDSSVDSDRSVSKGYVQRGPVDMHFINPVALTFDNLFGTFTSGAKGWAAGALTTIVSRLISNSSGFGGMRKINIEQRKWIILDGPAAQSWTEIIEGCMDDKRELLLPNGDRFRLPQVMTLIFEMNSIEKLSPSFISRCGLSSLNQPQSQSTENSFWKMLVDSWLTKKQVDVPTLRPYISVLRGLLGRSYLQRLTLCMK